jgi:hypothetical protein
VDDKTLQRLVDRLDIQDLLTTYATAIDIRELDTVRACFADDARARYGQTEEWLVGGDTVVAWIDDATKDLEWQHHMISLYGVEIDGDRATALAYLLSHQKEAGTTDEIRMMTSRYHNTLSRVDGRWKIQVLDLEVGWYEERKHQAKELSL